MKKKIALAILAAAVGAISSQPALAQSFGWRPGISTEPPTSIAGYGVLDYVNAGNPWDSGGNNQWTLNNPSVDGGWGAWSLWLMGPAGNSASAALGVPSTAVAFAMEGDWNDGYADFYVDSTYITTQSLWNLGQQSLVVWDLPEGLHTLQVIETGRKELGSGDTHAHVLGGAALATGVPDAGSTAALLSGVLVMLGTITRRIRK